MGFLYKQKSRDGTPGQVWWVKYYRDGRPIRESTGTANEIATRRFLKEREGREVFDRYHIVTPGDLQEAGVSESCGRIQRRGQRRASDRWRGEPGASRPPRKARRS